MKDQQPLELLLHKHSKKYLANIDLSNYAFKSSSKGTNLIVILDKSGSMDESVPKIVNKLIPKIINYLNIETDVTLITFHDNSEIYKGDAHFFKELNLEAYGSTYMCYALNQLEHYLTKLSPGTSLRILVFSDGDLHDQDEAMERSSEIANKFKGKFTINTQAIRYYSDSNVEPDTRGLSSILQLNSIITTPKIVDINSKEDINIMTQKICEYFKHDGLGLCLKLKSQYENLYYNPWEKPVNEIRLIKGKNMFWIENDGKFSEEKGNLEVENMEGSKIDMKIKTGETINLDNYQSILNDIVNFFLKKLKVLKVINTEESEKEIEQIVSFFETLEDSVFADSNIIDDKLSSRKLLVQNLIKKRRISITNDMKSIQNDSKVSTLNSKQQAEYLRALDINDKSGKNLAKRAFSGINFDEVTKKEVIKMSQNLPKLLETLDKKNFDDSTLSVSFFSAANTLDGIKTVCELVDDKETFEEITTLDVIRLLNIVGIGCDAQIGNFPDPMTYRIKEIYSGCFVSLSDVLDVTEKKRDLVDFNTKKKIINVIPVFENQDIHKFLLDNCPKLLEYTASIGMRRILADVNYTYDYTILAGMWSLIMKIMKENSEINNNLFCKLVDTYMVASRDHFSYLYPILERQINDNSNISIFMNNNGVTNMTSPIIHILETYSPENKKKIIPRILRALYQYETYLVCRKMIRSNETGDNKYINGYLEDLLGIDYEKYGLKLGSIFDTPPINPKFCDTYYVNEEKVLDFYKKYYWINYVPFIASYFEAFLESKTKDVKEVFKNIPEKTEENMKKFLEIEDLRKFQMYCIVQSFLFKEKIDRSDTKKKVMKIIDLKYTKNAEKMVKNYVSRQYSIEYALKTQKRNKEQIEIMKNELVDKMIKSENIDEFKSLFINGIEKGIFKHKIYDPSSKGVADLKNRLLTEQNIPLLYEKIKIFMSGTYNKEMIWNKGEAYRACFPDFKEFLSQKGKTDLYNEIAKTCHMLHIYRELPNRQGHSNDKPSYWASGYGSLSSYFKELDKNEIINYKKIHYNCCGVNGVNLIKKEKREERKAKRKEFKFRRGRFWKN